MQGKSALSETTPVADGGANLAASLFAHQDDCQRRVDELVGRMKPKLQACYVAGTKGDPRMGGAASFQVTIDAKGKAHPGKVETMLPKTVAACMQKIAKATSYPTVAMCSNGSYPSMLSFPISEIDRRGQLE